MTAAWVSCECCQDFLCMIHGKHVYECACPAIEEWKVDPYSQWWPQGEDGE